MTGLESYSVQTIYADANLQRRLAKKQTIIVCCDWLTNENINVRVTYFLILGYFLTTLTLILTLNDPRAT